PIVRAVRWVPARAGVACTRTARSADPGGRLAGMTVGAILRPHNAPAEHHMAASDYEVLDERFRNCVNRTAHVERLWTGARWTEGPVYFTAGIYVLLSDIP